MLQRRPSTPLEGPLSGTNQTKNYLLASLFLGVATPLLWDAFHRMGVRLFLGGAYFREATTPSITTQREGF